jgi:holo-[acyl-carrier protein] synthase
MILAIGIDLCEIARIRRALEGPHGARFRARVFTDGEQRYCERRRATRFESYAARFAAKEAAMKALGTGWADGVTWHDVEVRRVERAPPELLLHGRAAQIARERGMVRWHLALSHTTDAAVAWVLTEDAPLRAASRAGRRLRHGETARSGRRGPTGRP